MIALKLNIFLAGQQICKNVDCSIPGESQRCPRDCVNGKSCKVKII